MNQKVCRKCEQKCEQKVKGLQRKCEQKCEQKARVNNAPALAVCRLEPSFEWKERRATGVATPILLCRTSVSSICSHAERMDASDGFSPTFSTSFVTICVSAGRRSCSVGFFPTMLSTAS